MTREEYADFLLPNVEHDRAYYENLYPKRNLKEGARVVRVAPSPTGFVHFGTLFQGLMDRSLATTSDGVFILRIEDTDQKRELETGIEQILDALLVYDIPYDEGPISREEEKGKYGPYIQSKRKDIYAAFMKDMIIHDLAYPSFATAEELEEIRKFQEGRKARVGYYGKYAKDRYLSMEEVVERVKKGEKYAFRLKSRGDFENKVTYHDLVKGDVEFPENDVDYVLLKEDGLPTYHFAHVIDDYLMQVTHVVRGDEWLSSLPLHLELIKVLGLPSVHHLHTAPLMKEEDGIRRKLSKRKDPEANVYEFKKQGIPKEAVKEYLMTVINSNFEEWRGENPTKDILEFPISFEKMNVSGALFDMEKMINLSKNFISLLSAEEVYERVCAWAKDFDSHFYTLLKENKELSIATYQIERGGVKPRKDYTSFGDIYSHTWYMYQEAFDEEKKNYEFDKITDPEEIKKILTIYLESYYEESDDQETWFQKIKEMCDQLGYASNMKEYKQNPENYKGNVADVSTVLRVALTTKSRTPNLYDIMQILGHEEIKRRFDSFQKI